MPSSQASSQLADIFRPYIKSSDDLLAIRRHIAQYIKSLQPDDFNDLESENSISIPSHVTGLRRQYLQALYNNTAAQREYRQTRHEVQSQTSQPSDASSSINILQTHIEMLEIREKRRKYQVLAHGLAEAKLIADQNQLYDTQPTNTPSTSQFSSISTDKQSPLLAQAKELTRNLEIAVLQANHQLKRERQLLDDLKTQRTVPENTDTRSKLNALVATNAELTRWIEESLAKCDIADGSGNGGPSVKPVEKGEIANHSTEIEGQYEKYLEARTQLLRAASTLMKPLQQESAISTNVKAVQPSSRSSTSTTSCPIPMSPLPFVTNRYLSLEAYRQTLVRYESHIQQMLYQHQHDLTEQLLRLNDESHLLPSYPILAKSKSTQQDLSELEKLLGAWKFAMEAAEMRTEATIQSETTTGKLALEEAHAVLSELEESSISWKALELAQAKSF